VVAPLIVGIKGQQHLIGRLRGEQCFHGDIMPGFLKICALLHLVRLLMAMVLAARDTHSPALMPTLSLAEIIAHPSVSEPTPRDLSTLGILPRSTFLAGRGVIPAREPGQPPPVSRADLFRRFGVNAHDDSTARSLVSCRNLGARRLHAAPLGTAQGETGSWALFLARMRHRSSCGLCQGAAIIPAWTNSSSARS
jgi:hypothetical protein